MSSSNPLTEPEDSIEEPRELEIRNVLLLEDDVELALTLKALLEARDFMVTTVVNGAEGVKEILAFDFDAIVCDMMMPTMSGDMFFFAVSRAKPHLCKRFVFITGHGDDSKVTEFMEKVNGLVLHKPVHSDDLVKMIRLAAARVDEP